MAVQGGGRGVPGNKGCLWLWSEPARVGYGCTGWGEVCTW